MRPSSKNAIELLMRALRLIGLIALELRKYPYWSLLPHIVRRNYVKFDDTPLNKIHVLAILIIWGLVYIVLLSLLRFGLGYWTVASLLKWFGTASNIAGTIWIVAGVIYEPPKGSPSSLDALAKHVSDTFASASRHCVVGVGLFLIGVALQFLADGSFIISLQ